MHNWLIRYNESNPDKPQWTQSILEPCMYHLRGPNGCDERVDICVFVGDIMSSFTDTPLGRGAYSDFVEAFKKDYAIQDDGYQPCTQFTGMNLHWDWEGKDLYIDQPAVIDKILDRYITSRTLSPRTLQLLRAIYSQRGIALRMVRGDL